MTKSQRKLVIFFSFFILIATGCKKEEKNPNLAMIKIEQLQVRARPSAEEYAKVEEEAKKVLQKLQEGADFAEMARTYSTNTSGQRGGEMTVAEGWLEPELNKTVFSMPDSSLSGIIRTPEALYLAYREYGEYLQVRSSHILVKPIEAVKGESKEASFARAKDKAREIYQRVQKGENFYDLAKKYSEDEGSAQNGGDVGWTKRNFLDKDYETVAFGQKEGEISEPIRTRFGYHIVRTVKKKDLSLHVRLIEFKVPISDAELAKARAALEEAYKQARAGTELKTLAQRFADNPDGLFIYSEPYGVRKNMLVPELAVQIEKMGEGGITDIIERDKEYYFVRLIKKD